MWRKIHRHLKKIGLQSQVIYDNKDNSKRKVFKKIMQVSDIEQVIV